MKRITLLAFLVLGLIQVQAQQLELEKTYKISRASKRGNLAGLDYDPAAKTYTLTYFTDMKKRSSTYEFKYEQYVFDNDFNIIKEDEFTEEADKMKKKFKWFRFKGEEYVTVGNTVENNMMGTLVIRKKKITSKYSFLLGGYNRKVEVLEKVKPKSDDGNLYTLITYAEDEMTGDLYIVATVKPKIGSKNMEGVGSVRLLKFNSELDLVKTSDFNFKYPQALAFINVVDKENFDDPESPGIESLVMVWAPSNAGGKKNSDPNNNNYEYTKISSSGDIVERFNFESPASFWRIDQLIVNDKDGTSYLYGPAAAGKDKYFNEGVKAGPSFGRFGSSEVKFKSVQLMKITGGKMTYLTETLLDEFKAKQKFPPNQRKTPDYDGREFGVRSYQFASNGDLFVLGQNYDKDGNGAISKFTDVLGFQFDTNGKLKAQYGLDTKEKGIAVSQSTSYGVFYKVVSTTVQVYACPQTLIEAADGNIYWILQEIKGMGPNDKMLTYPRIAKVNKATADIGEMKTFGKGDGFYLHPQYPFLETDKAETVVFFGADKPGKELWFARVKLK